MDSSLREPQKETASGSKDPARSFGYLSSRYEAFFEQEVRTLAAAFSVMVAVA